MLPGVLELLGIGSKLFEAQKEVERLEDELRKIRDVFRVKHVDATLVYSSHKAVQIDSTAIVRIPADKYVQVAPGIFDRAVEGPHDIKFPFEEQFADEIKTKDFENNYVIFVRFEANGSFSKHFHLTEEVIYYLKGEVVGETGGKLFRGHEVQKIKAREEHVFHPLQDGYALIELAKK